jgi:nicotinamide-nucleotide amidase
MLSEIITIGDEILIGQIVDTNSAWMAQKLNDAGIRVKQISSVSDDRQHILDSLTAAANRADIILITGGLGPTKDDITKKTLAEYFNVGLTRNEEAVENVKRLTAHYKVPLLDVNLRQADVLDNCKILLNKNGTAPGMWVESNGKIYVSMPGVPFEMMYLMEEEVIPRLKQQFSLPSIVHHTILTAGLGESFLANTIAEVEDALPSHIKLAYLPKLGQLRLRLSAFGNNKEALLEETKVYGKKIIALIKPYVIAEADKPFEKVILDFMEARNLTLSVAESCTGGHVSQLLTQHPGSSKVFFGGAVCYSNNLKKSMLGVSTDTLINYGAVSEQTVTELASACISTYQSDYSIAISGIAGPDGGTEEKPVGTVWIAVANKNKVVTKLCNFGNRRAQNIERSGVNALTLLFSLLKEDNSDL